MPTTYNGVTTGINAREQVSISEPAGTDVRNSQSVRTPLEKLANYLQFLMAKAGLLDVVSTWTAKQTMSGGIGGLPAPAAGSNDAARKVDVETAAAATLSSANTYTNGKVSGTAMAGVPTQNGWVPGGVNLVYWKDHAGLVHVSGMVTAGPGSTSRTNFAALPDGFRPYGLQGSVILVPCTLQANGTMNHYPATLYISSFDGQMSISPTSQPATPAHAVGDAIFIEAVFPTAH